MTKRSQDIATTVDTLLERCSEAIVPPQVEDELRAKLQNFIQQHHNTLAPARGPVLQRHSRWALIAASLTIAGSLAAIFLTIGARDAWAQVTKALNSKVWVRMTLQIPAEVQMTGEIPREMLDQPPETWFSAANKLAAGRFLGAAQFVDFGRQESYRYDPKDKTVYRQSISDDDQRFFDQLDILLSLVSEGDRRMKLPESPIQFLSRAERSMREQDRDWKEYTFECRDPRRVPADYTVTIKVDATSNLPVEMRSTERMAPGDKSPARRYRFDYPETGPTDIYALGVPQTAAVVDWRRPDGAKEIVAAHMDARRQRMEPYSAIILVSDPQSSFADVHTAFQVDFDGKMWRSKQADIERLLELRQRVWAKEIGPGDDMDNADWWKAEVRNLAFGEVMESANPSGNPLFPDCVALYDFGNPNAPGAQITIDRRPTSGPAETIRLGVRTSVTENVFWMDAKRNYLALRFECPSGDGVWKYRATLVDKLEKSPGGHWYATEARVGNIQSSGNELPTRSGEAPVTTSVYRYFVEFK